MKLSVKSDYAARAVLGLARQYATGEAIRADDLASEEGIPVNYLVQILIELKATQIVRSVRGKEGGYLWRARRPISPWGTSFVPSMGNSSTLPL
ncbi:MAG: Rrf2 family transcriptional regulator [Verrucomicrobiota bacterium]